MKQNITKSDFREAFYRMGRRDNFSYEALGALYDYLEEDYGDGADGEYCLDVIQLCCECMEDSIATVLDSYDLKSLDELKQETTVIWHDENNVLYVVY